MLIATVLSLTLPGAVVSETRETEREERLMKGPGVMFVPGSLTELGTPPVNTDSLRAWAGR